MSNAFPRPVERRNKTFAGQSVETLREMVLRGTLEPGQRLNEVELSTRLGISRGPLREAITTLASEGLLTVISHRGAFVRTFDISELKDLWELRIALETHAVRLAALNASEATIATMVAMLDETKQVIAVDRNSYPSDLDFHERLIAMSGSKSLLDATTQVHRQVHIARARAGWVRRRIQHSYDEHFEVASYIQARDPDRAAHALATHLRASLTSVLSLYEPFVDQADTSTAGPPRKGART